MNGTRIAERRAHARACVSVPVRIRIDATGQVLRYTTRNISPSGVFIDTTDPLPLGASLSIRFHVPDLDVRIQAEGRVVRSRPTGMAIQFTDDALIRWDFLNRLVQDEDMYPA
jgi:hypothetical protein